MKKTTLTLLFSDEINCELSEIRFDHPCLTKERISYRGRLVSGNQSGNFQWTNAVKALCLFFVRAKLLEFSAEERGYHKPILAGESESAAASLDYALSRQSGWLLDAFGSDADGVSLLRRVTLRSNPERKRPGPVTIHLNSKCLTPQAIEIFVGQTQLTEERSFKTLEQFLSTFWNNTSKKTRASQIAPRTHSAGTRQLLKDMLLAEISVNLWNSSAFTKSCLKSKIEGLMSSKSFAPVKRIANSFFDSIDYQALTTASTESLDRNNEVTSSPIRVSVPAAVCGPIALCEYVNSCSNTSLALDYNYSHAGEVLERIKKGAFDPTNEVFVLGEGHLLSLLESPQAKHFTALMPLPSISFQVVQSTSNSKSDSTLSKGTYLFIEGERSSSSVYFEELVNRGLISKNKTNNQTTSLETLNAAVRSGGHGLKVIQWFPHYSLNRKFFNGTLLDSGSGCNYRGNYLVAHRDLLRQATPTSNICASLQNAWKRLIESPLVLNQVVDGLCNNRDYLDILLKTSGISTADGSSEIFSQQTIFLHEPDRRHVAL